MTTRRLTFPAPRRVSDRTGTQSVARTHWLLRKLPGGHNAINNELILRTHPVEQPVFATRPWGEHDILALVSHGGWFDFSVTDFESKAAREFAMAAQQVQMTLVGE